MLKDKFILFTQRTSSIKATYKKKKNEDYLSEKVQRKPREEDVGKELHNVKTSENHPVDQPLRVVFFLWAFHRLHSKKLFINMEIKLCFN